MHQATDSESCYHCSEPLPARNAQAFNSSIAGKTRFFCCPACQSVAETIYNLGFSQYYLQRDEKPQQPASVAQHSAAQDFADRDIHENYTHFMRNIDENTCEAQLFIPDIHCASCCWLIEQHLSHIPGVTRTHSQLDNHKLVVRWKNNALKPSAIFSALAQIGYSALPWQPTQQQQHLQQQQQQLLRRLGVAGLLAMQIHMIAMGSYFGADHATQSWLNAVALLLSLPMWFYCADPFFSSAWRNLKSFRHSLRSRSYELLSAGMDLPIALAIVAAAIASIISVIRQTNDLYFDSIGMLVFLLLGARYMEAQARARIALQAQEPQLAQSCTRVDSDGKQQRVAINILNRGDHIFIESGQIPVDGIVLQGVATVDQSALTGEFMPTHKTIGDTIIAGTSILQGELLLRVTAWGEDSHIAQLYKRMEQALQRKNDRNVYDHVARWFTPLVLLIASSSALFWLWRDPSVALPAFLAVLVASCPCALSLAIPAALTAATLQLRQQGILITGGHVLHLMPDIRAMAFDKTGTLTQGRMKILGIETFANLTENECLVIASSMEHSSSHPVATAFVENSNIQPTSSEINQVLHCGVEATVNKLRYRIGKLEWCLDNPGIIQKKETAELSVALTTGKTLLAIFTLGDDLRTDAADCLGKLQKQGMHCAIISGDHSQAVDAIAKKLFITDVHKNCSPELKVEQLEALKKTFGGVAMVGDGINDGPVLAHADVSLALADSTHAAQLAADVVLLNNRLSDVFTLQQVARRTRRIARQNLVWALLYNVSILPLAAAGALSPAMAALGMAISSILVTLNALRLFSVRRSKLQTASQT